jgi:cellulose synthase/poly-beta-1,6-N-acetylglucosamine synthase-like glycosyltransferase
LLVYVLDMNYLLALALNTALFWIINYVIGNTWAFARKSSSVPDIQELQLNSRYPFVSVVVPVKNSQRTIGSLVDSLLAQDYPGKYEVILAGDVGDSTWEPIRNLLETEPKLRYLEMKTSGPGNDANLKRNRGLELASGEILALTDSDMVMPRDWISRGVEEMAGGWHCVAGGMVSTHQDFWGRYVDANALGGKTPRIAKQYVVSAENFGGRGAKPPITANVFFSWQLLQDTGGLDENMRYTYEDYEWFWRVATCGYQTLMVPKLVAGHHHRQGVKNLTNEYWRSGRGCVDFIIRHPRCPLALRRRAQLPVVLATIVVGLGGLVAAAVTQDQWYLSTIVAIAAVFGGLGAFEAYKTHNLEAVMYPLITFLFGMVFTAGMVRGVEVRHFRPLHHRPPVVCPGDRFTIHQGAEPGGEK